MGITNDHFCSPEIGFLFFIQDIKNNLFNLMKDRKVCIITCRKNVTKRLQRENIDASTFLIPAVGKGHYNVFGTRVQQLQEYVRDKRYDLYLISAGALGKGYSYHIKTSGGISVDIGQVDKFWVNGKIAARFKGILMKADPYTFKFTKKGEKFRKFL